VPSRILALVVVIVATLIAVGTWAWPRQRILDPRGAGGTSASKARPSRTITMEELHRNGGVPPGWKFTLPAGEPARGRQVFIDLKCSACHAVAGESFAPDGGNPKNAGPELTGMGAHHPAEYFAEAIVNPDAVTLAGPGYTGPDGRSIMPSYADSMSVAQLLDLVAYLKSLTAPALPGAGRDHDASH